MFNRIARIVGKSLIPVNTCGLNETMKVAMITCWYKDISMANYSASLQNASGTKVDWQIVSSHCGCGKRYKGRKQFLQGNCKFVSLPPYIPALEDGSGPRALRPLLSVSNLFLQSLRGIAYLAKCKDSDIIHYQQSASQSFGMSALNAVLSIPVQKKRIVTVHSIDPMMRFRVFSRSYKNADRILVHSKEMQEKMLALSVPESRVKLVPHGATLPPLSKATRKEVTFFGCPNRGKGFWTILQALKILRDQNREVRLHIYGIYSEAEKNEAVNASTQFGVDDLLVWGSRLSETEFDLKMQESLFTLAVYSLTVSGSNVVTRAMANGTPIIASNIGGIPEYLGNEGLLIPPNDSQALAQAMVKLLDDLSLREKFSIMARKRAENFSWDKVAETTTAIYLECLRENHHN
jgi:glycosyltransferase involved in cell wall biosynthesis